MDDAGAGERAEPEPSLVALRAAVYRPGADDADVAALRRALERLPAPVPERQDADPPATTDEPGAVPVPAPAPATAPRWVRPAAAAGAALAGAVGGALLVAGAAAAPPRQEVPTVVQVTAAATTAVFDRGQRPADRPTVALDPALEPGSVRGLLTAGRFRVYGARDRSGRVCLVAAQEGSMTACASPERFRQDGLLLVGSADILTIDSVGLRQQRSRIALVATWSPQGQVTLGAARP